MPIDNLNVGRSHPMWGNMNWTSADLSPQLDTLQVKVLDAVSVATTSTAQSLGARGLRLTVSLSDPTKTCDLQLFTTVGGVDTLVQTWTGLTHLKAVFAGQLEHIDLQGSAIKVRVQNIGGGSVTVLALVTR